jgi:predicted small metal-binding protein
MPGCAAEFHADEESDLLDHIVRHATEAHADVELTPATRSAVQEAIRRVA